MMRYLLPLILVLATCWAGIPIPENVNPQPNQEMTTDDYRLPKDVIPINYFIELTPYLDTNDEKNFTFDGYSEIDLEIKENTKTITFHANQLKIADDVKLSYSQNGKSIKILKTEINEQMDFVTLNLEEELNSTLKNIKLSLNFTGVLNDNLRGFYRSSYQNGNKTRWLATTHFEPVAARQAFPCWDEPALKATFNIVINYSNKNYHALSNMLGKNEKNGTTIFPQTRKMSPYLVAFVVSDYKNNTNKEGNLSVWTRPNAINSTDFALEIGQETLKVLNEFTGIDYYTPKNMSGIKMDQISIPDFAAGAMENWGLVTYRESGLLYTEGKSTTQDKQAIAKVIAHEFAHQWFGDLVTCDWWDYIWLNEGFATFFEYYTTEQVVQNLYNDSWRLMDQFVIKNLQASAFVVDATIKTRPLNPDVSAKTPAQISSLFDDIAYKKGGSILRMLQQFLTEDIFQNGLRRYLNENQFTSVTPFQLFKAFTDDKIDKRLPNNTSLMNVMDNWLNKSGYPVVTVSKISESDQYNLTQERFFLVKPVEEDTTQWYIPITYVKEEAPNDIKSFWMIPGEPTIVTISNVSNWILFNKNQAGYYRVNYDDENWKKLAEYLNTENFENISSTNRAQLIDDALNLASAGYLPHKVSLQIITYLSKETDYMPWFTAIRAFDYLDGVLYGSKFYDSFHAFVAQKIKTFTETVNYTNPEGTHVEKLGKVLALDTACKYGLEDCETFAQEKLNEWLEGKEELSPDLKNGIICAGLRKGNEETWEKIVEKYKNNTDEQANILTGLGCASKDIVNKFLNSTIEKDPIIDILSAMSTIADRNAEAFEILLNFTNAHIQEIQEADKDNTKLPIIFNKLANKVSSSEQYIKLSEAVYEHLKELEKFTGWDSALKNLAWIKSYQEEVGKFFEEKIKEQNSNSATSFTLTSFLLIIPLLLARFN